VRKRNAKENCGYRFVRFVVGFFRLWRLYFNRRRNPIVVLPGKRESRLRKNWFEELRLRRFLYGEQSAQLLKRSSSNERAHFSRHCSPFAHTQISSNQLLKQTRFFSVRFLINNPFAWARLCFWVMPKIPCSDLAKVVNIHSTICRWNTGNTSIMFCPLCFAHYDYYDVEQYTNESAQNAGIMPILPLTNCPCKHHILLTFRNQGQFLRRLPSFLGQILRKYPPAAHFNHFFVT
jgi:hypothetical protein